MLCPNAKGYDCLLQGGVLEFYNVVGENVITPSVMNGLKIDKKFDF